MYLPFSESSIQCTYPSLKVLFNVLTLLWKFYSCGVTAKVSKPGGLSLRAAR